MISVGKSSGVDDGCDNGVWPTRPAMKPLLRWSNEIVGCGNSREKKSSGELLNLGHRSLFKTCYHFMVARAIRVVCQLIDDFPKSYVQRRWKYDGCSRVIRYIITKPRQPYQE
jgi:hypothetical protein